MQRAGALRVVARCRHFQEIVMSARLARITVTRDGDAYLMQIEDEAGGRLDLSATAEQIDVIAEALDDLLAMDDAEKIDD
jgi:hypothetical protein